MTDPPESGSDVRPAAATVASHSGRLATRVLRVGVVALVIGLLVYFAARSSGGGLAGILLSSLLWWAAFEFAVLPVRAIWRTRQKVNAQHAILGGCLTAVSVCGGGGVFLLFGQQLILGLIIGPLIAYLTHRAEVISLARSLGLDSMLPSAPTPASLIQLPGPRWALAVVGLVSFLAGLIFMGLGMVRSLEVFTVLADVCTHPCGMVHGVWVDLVPGSGGALVTRLDPAAVQLQVRFRDDVPGASVVSRDDFTLEMPPATYPQLTDRPACGAWPPQTIHIDDITAVLALCFAVPESESVDFSQFVLDWRQPGSSVQVLLGRTQPTGVTRIGVSPSPS